MPTFTLYKNTNNVFFHSRSLTIINATNAATAKFDDAAVIRSAFLLKCCSLIIFIISIFFHDHCMKILKIKNKKLEKAPYSPSLPLSTALVRL